MKKILTILVVMTVTNMVIAQNFISKRDTVIKEDVYAEEDLYEDDPYFWSYTKEIGLNMTPLVSKFVPFNLGENSAGLVNFRWKKYYGKRAFRFGLGANLSLEDEGSLFISIGSERRYPISKSKKLSYSSGWDIAGFAESSDDDGFLGAMKTYGIEYHFTKRIFISTEAALRVGFGDDIFDISFDPPAAIFLNVRLY